MNASVGDVVLLEQRISRLNNIYARCIDDDRLEDWPELFLEDGRYIINPRENRDAGFEGGFWMYYTSQGMMRDRVTALRHINVFNTHYYRHLINDTIVEKEEGGVITARTNYLVVETSHEGKSALLNAGEYIDKVVSVDGELKFLEKLVVPDTFHTCKAIIAPL